MVYLKLFKYYIPKLLSAILLLFLIYDGFILQNSNSPKSGNTLGVKETQSQITIVTKVIDGDTIVLKNGQTVRYVGIDAPELHHPKKKRQCYAEQSKEKNSQLVLGKRVRLEKDISETDKYGRLLRYVYVVNASNKSVLSVNEKLVEEGYARVATFSPDVFLAQKLTDWQNKARDLKLGLWDKCQFE